MPKAEVGSTKYLNNKLKSKGLQRLRWYCQVCERQMRDENGFKMHTQSEGHVRQMLLVGEDPKKYINDYSSQFQRDFLQLLRTAHGEKQVHMNHFYQEYIANKEHIHMNATKWPSLTEFAKYLGREGICRVEDTEKGLHIAWIDNSPEALRRQDAIRKKERQDRGDEEREQILIREQIERAKREAVVGGNSDVDEEERELKRADGEKVVLSFGKKSEGQKKELPSVKAEDVFACAKPSESAVPLAGSGLEEDSKILADNAKKDAQLSSEAAAGKIPVKVNVQAKPKNIFASAKKNALAGKKTLVIEQPKKMTEAERIMKEELDRKRSRDAFGSSGPGPKKQRF
jgi:DNA/RNA-binding protein KIN17